jgi:Uncharacterised nucleotidyltransferase
MEYVAESPRYSLLRILLANEEVATESARQVTLGNEWPAVFKLAATWSVATQLGQRVTQLGLQPPTAEWREFKQVVIANYAHSATRAAKGIAAIHCLEECGVAAIAFKGLASMARLYVPPANRTIKDADLLVQQSSLSAAVACLGKAGFAPMEGHDLLALSRFLDDSPGFSGNKAIVLYGPEDFEIDLHWSVGLPGLSPDALLLRSDRVMLFGRMVPIVGMGDGMILTARHAIRENLAIDAMCRDLFDIRQSCSLMASREQLVSTLEAAATASSMVPLLALLEILADIEGTNGDVTAARGVLAGLANPDQLKAASQLRSLFFRQVTGGPMVKDLLYLFHLRPARQIFAGASQSWREYREFMRTLERKLEGEEVPLGRRLWQLFFAVRKIGPAHLRSIRTLARLKYDS